MSDEIDKRITKILKPPDFVQALDEIKNTHDEQSLHTAVDLVYLCIENGYNLPSHYTEMIGNQFFLDIIRTLLLYEYDALVRIIVKSTHVDLSEDNGDLVEISKHRDIGMYLYMHGAPKDTLNYTAHKMIFNSFYGNRF